ncbi:hypothetical protein AQUCO_03700144v1 [Aquilegia coerulea]|uniref:Peptidase A1 domain-containing protein n=1 Tax=Aquilegia coerulea TaxID=218851 RepID=A0A2G5CTS3_AQUCA|nr:hypothetical protein AQUCO_03700144v1 [Aquilegia coerulea]
MAMVSASSIMLLIAFFLIQFLNISPSFSSSIHIARNTPTEFSARLINRNSVKSPFHNPKLTHSDRVKAAVRTTIARQKYFQSKQIRLNDMINPPVKPHSYEYVMTYSIGTPPVETFAVVDTASDLIWLQCLPCELCYKQTIPYFDPAKSQFFKKIPCGDPDCKGVQSTCKNSVCQYQADYADGSYTEGDLVLETLTFRRSQSNPPKLGILNIIVGCGHNNTQGEDTDDYPGTFGLNRGPLSIITQLGYGGFSYCLVPRDNTEAESSLHFQVYQKITGSSTPMLDGDQYYVNLEGISVGDERLAIPPGTFNRTEGIGGFIIDSGSGFTSLEPDAYSLLILAIEKHIGGRTADPEKVFSVCYDAKAEDISKFPVITFHFTGVNLEIGPSNTWINQKKTETGGIYCLAMFQAFGVSVLGNYQQQNVNVQYDSRNKLISFQPMDCTKAG